MKQELVHKSLISANNSLGFMSNPKKSVKEYQTTKSGLGDGFMWIIEQAQKLLYPVAKL